MGQRANRYRIIKELSNTSIVYCFLAEDLDEGGQVILREVPKGFFRERGYYRFKTEARLTSSIRCETYASPIDYEVGEKNLRVVYPYTEGVSLSSKFHKAPLSAAEAMGLARDLLDGLDHIHRIGCIHRDIRPSNIIVRPDGRSVLCGYVPLWCPELFGKDDLLARECASYTSPELSGIIDHDICESSDLYSVGYVLYAALTGETAFDGDVSEILYQHMTADPDASRYPDDTPDAVIQLIDKLICKEPRDRYQSARAALHDVDAISQALLGDVSFDDFVVGAADQRSVIIDPAFVGRDAQVKVLEQTLEDVVVGKSQKILMTSESGMGKTRLLNEVARVASRKRFLVLRGRATEHAAQQPAAVWLQAIDQLVKHLANDPLLLARTMDRMEDYRQEVATAMPQLAKSFGWNISTLSGPDVLGQGRVVSAFRSLFTGLGTADRSLMITLDDCQWMDDQSFRILIALCEAPSEHCFLFAVARPDEGISNKLQSEVEVSQKLSLGPLTPHAVKQLAESMAGQLPDVAIEVVQRFAEGSPFMAAAVLRGLVESDALRSVDKVWQVDHDQLSSFQTADGAGDILVDRLSRLPDDARNILAVAAVIGREFSLDIAADLVGISVADAHNAIHPARMQRLVWSRPDRVLSFVHDKIREAILEELSTATIKTAHGQIGRYLEANEPHEFFRLAYHYDAADMHQQALPNAIHAAKIARNSFSLVSAQEQLQIAVRALHHSTGEHQLFIEMMMSEVLLLQGEYDTAEEWLDRADKSVDSSKDQARVLLRRGELWFKRGNKDQAVECFEASLRQLQQPVCSTPIQLGWNLAIEGGRQLRNSLFPSLCGKRQIDPSEQDQMSLSLYSQIAHAYWYTRNKYFTLWAHLRGMNAAEEYHPTRFLAQTYSEHAPVMTLVRWEKRGIQYASRSLEIRKSLGDVWGQGQSRNFLSILLYSFSRYEACIDQARQAVDVLERTGDYWEVHIARYQLAASLYRMGKFDEAVELSQVNYQSAIKRGDFQATGNIIDVWVRAASGNVPVVLIDLELSRDVIDAQRTCQVLIAKGVHDFYHDRFSEAAASFEKAVLVAQKTKVKNSYVSPAHAWMCSALRRKLETTVVRNVATRRQAVKRLYRTAKKAVSISKEFTNDRPHALREFAAVLAISGKQRKSRLMFQRSLDIAKQQNANAEYAETLVLYAEYAKEFGWPIDEDETEQAKERLSKFSDTKHSVNESGSLSLLDRFDSLLASGRRIATSVMPQEIYNEVRAAAAKILRGEQVFLILEDADGEISTVPPVQRFDPSILDESRRLKQTVVRDQEICVLPGTSDSDKGTFLCCPIDVNNETVAFLYVVNRRFSGIYGDDEIRIADYLASAAGAALEKADSFFQLHDLNQNLERKVKERTDSVVRHSKELERTAQQLTATQEKLQLAKSVAEEANAAKSDFLARMSHEIRTPISGILGFTDLMLRGVVSDDAERTLHLQTIHSNAFHLLDLLNDILDISKIEADKLVTESVMCNPILIIGDVVTSMQSQAMKKKIELGLRVESSVPDAIVSDSTRLRQILTNLVSNALKFTDQGGVTLVVRTLGPAAAPDQLQIVVEDTGIGMTPEQMASVFEPFKQADVSTTRKYGGTGLGLSISKRLADALGGTIDIESEQNVGTQMILTLKIDCPDDVRLIDPDEVLSTARGHRNNQFLKCNLSGVRVLVVDDGESNRKLLSLLLADSGAIVNTACNGQEAVDVLMADHDSADIVLMDMQMPVLDGYSAVELLREKGFQKPVVALTANAMVGDEGRCRTAGCTEYLTKPIDLNALLRIVAANSVGEDACEMISVEHAAGVDQAAPASPIALQVRHDGKESMSSSNLLPAYPALSDDDDFLDDDWLETFASELVEQVDVVLPSLIEASIAGDMDTIAKHLHQIKGSGGTVGLDKLSEIAAKGEQAIVDSQWENISSTLAELQEFVSMAKAAR
ncbi:ATP-binding protein [Rubripirellula lacrimiformis]|uniref:ATP-binding protein n=1 Tax=Rubripirellula lacrimiformis TaxID=1930273 RepID=UPI0011A249C4|nr:ATP-binding protein [Rubripirellula lacrimiformis]